MARQCGCIRQNNIVTDPAVMGYMSIGHEEIIASCDRLAASSFRTAMKCNELSEGVVFADDQFASFAVKLQVLRDLPDRRKRKKSIVSTDDCGTFHDHMRCDFRTGVDSDAFPNHGIRTHGTVLCQFGFRMDNCCWMDT